MMAKGGSSGRAPGVAKLAVRGAPEVESPELEDDDMQNGEDQGVLM